jgi:hypothetical protein
MKEQLIHILDQSVCLSRKQMKEYLNGTMLPEEAHAAEVHLSSCPLCSLAMEGFEEHSEEALAAISALNSGFLKEHFDNISPQIHLNSMAPTASLSMAQSGRKRASVQPLWRVSSIAAGLLLLFGLVWAWEHRSKETPALQKADLRENITKAGTAGHGNSIAAGESVPSSTGQSIPPATAKAEQGSATNVNREASQNPGPIPPNRTSIHNEAVPLTVSDSKQMSQSGSGIEHSVAAKDVPPTSTFKDYNPATDGLEENKTAGNGNAESTTKAGTTTAPKYTAKQGTEEKADVELSENSYGRGSIKASLESARKGMNSADPHTRYHSMIIAAQCYQALGNTVKAEQLLQQVVDNGPGPERRQARRVLRKMQ